jgi:protocatechuate 3,4-dioxygenase beta subunit
MKNMNRQPANLKFDLKLNRRAFMIGGAAAISTASRILTAAPRCTLTPEQEEGPYYVDFGKTLRDVTEGKPGVPLQLRVALVDAKRCEPLESAAVDIWHCDATGVYSGFTANGGGDDAGRGFGPTSRGIGGRGGPGRGGPGGPDGPGGRGGDRGRGPVDETRFLRGIQITNRQGIAEFATVYPGWYAGRTIHVHLKVHLGGSAEAERYTGGHVSHTGQLFLPEDITEQIAKMDPYVKHANVHRTLHSEDNIFRQQGGAQSMLTLERLQKGTNAGGFIADIVLAVDPEATPVAF